MMRWPLVFLITTLAYLSADSADIQVIKRHRTPVNDNIKVRLSSEGIVNENNPFFLKVYNFPVGVDTETDSFYGFRKNPNGTTILIFFDGKERIYITNQDNSPFIEQRTYFQRSFRKKLSEEFLKKIPKGKVVVTGIALNSYYETIKLPNAVDIAYMDIVEKGSLPDPVEEALRKPYLLYSQPTGTFADDQPILLDFYLFNVNLSSAGYQVQLSIDGHLIETFTEWNPYEIRGLKVGSHDIKLTLIDKSGKAVTGPYGDYKETIQVASRKK